jgi:hypothetical protein
MKLLSAIIASAKRRASPGYQFLKWPSDNASARWSTDNKNIQITKP